MSPFTWEFCGAQWRPWNRLALVPSIVNSSLQTFRMRSRTCCNSRSLCCASLTLSGIANWRMSFVSSFATHHNNRSYPIVQN
jgi:hypothetical protein